MSAPDASMSLVDVKIAGIGLDRRAILQIGESLLPCRHRSNKSFRLVEDLAELARDSARIDRLRHRQIGIVIRSISGVASNLGDQTFRRVARVLADGRPQDAPSRMWRS